MQEEEKARFMRDWEIALQRELNAMPAPERKRRVRELRLMRRFAGPFHTHPKKLQSRHQKRA